MAYDIGPKIGIEGEKEFRQNIQMITTRLRTLGTEMQAVTSKFDKEDKSMAAVTARKKVLSKQIDEQKQKLSELKKGLAAASDKYGENNKVTQKWQAAVNRATADLNNMQRELDQSGKKAKKSGDDAEKGLRGWESFRAGLGAVAKAAGAAAAAAGATAVMLAKEVVGQFGELEQNLGGSEAVFGKYAKSIQKTGEDAYKNLGTSQSQYLATANKMGALFQGSGLEQQKSLELTEKAMQRAADMASVMGIDMQVALDSVAGAAKGNFTMMDNLGVAMNATNIEAYALAKGLDFTWKTASQAEKAEIAMQMFFENTEQYAGNFARESTETVTGSIGLLKAALGSFTAGLGNADADMQNLTENLVDAFQSVVKNIVPILENIVKALPTATGAILSAIGKMLPMLLKTVTDIFSQVLKTILKLLPKLIPAGVDAVLTITRTLIDNLPLIIDAAIQLVTELVTGITEALPELIPAAVEAIITIVQTLVDNLPMLIDVAIELVLALVEGIIDALPIIIEAMPKLVKSLIDGIVGALPKLIDAAVQILTALTTALIEKLPLLIQATIEIMIALAAGLIEAIPELLMALPEIFGAIRETLQNMDWGEIGGNILKGIADGVTKAVKWLVDAAKRAARAAMDGVKDLLGINSPSTVMRDEVGVQMAYGVGGGFVQGMRTVIGQMQAAMRSATAGLSGSVNMDIAANIRNANAAAAATLTRSGAVNVTYETHYHSPKALSLADMNAQDRLNRQRAVINMAGG
mgnify:CR=1 FL=1